LAHGRAVATDIDEAIGLSLMKTTPGFKESNHFSYTSSHSGDPMLAAAGVATLEFIEQNNLLENIRNTGAYLKSGLEDLRDRFEVVGAVRGRGLKLGVEFVTDKVSKTPAIAFTQQFTARCRDKGLILGNSSEGSVNVIRILPGFTLTRQQVDHALHIIEESIVETVQATTGVAPREPVAATS